MHREKETVKRREPVGNWGKPVFWRWVDEEEFSERHENRKKYHLWVKVECFKNGEAYAFHSAALTCKKLEETKMIRKICNSIEILERFSLAGHHLKELDKMDRRITEGECKITVFCTSLQANLSLGNLTQQDILPQTNNVIYQLCLPLYHCKT